MTTVSVSNGRPGWMPFVFSMANRANRPQTAIEVSAAAGGSCLLLQPLPKASAPGLGSFAPPGLDHNGFSQKRYPDIYLLCVHAQSSLSTPITISILSAGNLR